MKRRKTPERTEESPEKALEPDLIQDVDDRVGVTVLLNNLVTKRREAL